jgi:hypothetical protein
LLGYYIRRSTALGLGWVAAAHSAYRRQTLAEMVVQFAKSITTKATKVHEGNI